MNRETLRFVSVADVRHAEIPGGGCFAWLCDADLTGAEQLGIRRVELGPGQTDRFHRHPHAEQATFVISGSAEQWIERERRVLGPGDLAHVPPGVVHATFNAGDRSVEFLEIFAPGGADGPETVDMADSEPWKSLANGHSFRLLDVERVREISVARILPTAIVERASVERIRTELFRLADHVAVSRIVLDFERVEFLSSTALSMLLQVSERLKARRGRMRLCRLRPEIHEVFQVTQLHRKIEILPGISEAVAGFE